MSMDLIGINNVIVGLRGPVQKARVHVIHHLSRQAGQLKAKKGSEEQRSKNLRKAERFAGEIRLLREAKKDDLARFALRSKKSLEQVLGNTEDLKSRSYARISNHSAVSRVVDDFRRQHPDWEKHLQALTDRLGRVQNKKSPGVKARKREKQGRKKSRKQDNRNTELTDQSEGVKEEDRIPEQQEEDAIFVSSLKSLIGDRGKEEYSDEADKSVDGGIPDPCEELNTTETAASEGLQGRKATRSQEVFSRRAGTMEIKTLDMDRESSDSADEDESDCDELADDEQMQGVAVVPERKKDSFFLGGESESEDDDDGDDNEDDRKRGAAREGAHRPSGEDSLALAGHGSRKGDEFSHLHARGSTGTVSRARGAGRGRGARRTFERWNEGQEGVKEAAALHPSWAAKRRAQQNLGQSSFQGKRTLLDEGEEAERPKVKDGKARHRDRDKEIHPSWAARKSQNRIADFKGKKTVFD